MAVAGGFIDRGRGLERKIRKRSLPSRRGTGGENTPTGKGKKTGGRKSNGKSARKIGRDPYTAIAGANPATMYA